MKYLILFFLAVATISCVPSIVQQQAPEEPVASEAPLVTIYSTSWCGWCKVAKKFLEKLNDILISMLISN